MIGTLLNILAILGLMIACALAAGVLIVIVAAVLMILKEICKKNKKKIKRK